MRTQACYDIRTKALHGLHVMTLGQPCTRLRARDARCYRALPVRAREPCIRRPSMCSYRDIHGMQAEAPEISRSANWMTMDVSNLTAALMFALVFAVATSGPPRWLIQRFISFSRPADLHVLGVCAGAFRFPGGLQTFFPRRSERCRRSGSQPCVSVLPQNAGSLPSVFQTAKRRVIPVSTTDRPGRRRGGRGIVP